jgi:hypothetical protein
MNERILELAKHAGLKSPSETAMSPVELKFAELIVQECSNFLKDTLDDHFAAEQLEEHFGVEE